MLTRTPYLTVSSTVASVFLTFAACLSPASKAISQVSGDTPSAFDQVGQTTSGGHTVPYRIRRLPVSSFPDLPAHVAKSLTAMGCLIPQTWQAHRPENAIHGSFEVAGSYDWAVLCSAKGRVSLLIFLASQSDDEPGVVASSPDIERLGSRDGSTELGFNWGIDVAHPQQVHEAQAGMNPRPPTLDHDAIADSTVGGPTSFYFSENGEHWDKIGSAQKK